MKLRSNSRWSHKISRSGLNEAIDLMRIKRKVTVRINKDELPWGKLAAYTPNEDGSHLIFIQPWLSRPTANLAILHELVHAAQTEYYGIIKVEPLYSDLSDLTDEWDNPLEVEARRWADALTKTVRIAL